MPIVISEIESLIKQRQLKKANKMLQEYFRTNGIDTNGQKVYKKLQNAIQRHNEEIGTHSMNEIQSLIKQTNFHKALEKLNLAKKHLEHDPRFQKFYIKTIKAINSQNSNQYKQFLKLQRSKIKKLIKKNKENQALKEVQELCMKHPNNPNIKILLQETKQLVVIHKYKKNKVKLKKIDTKTRLEFYLKLYEIDKTNQDIKRELAKAKKEIDQQNYFQKDQYLIESEMQIKVLYNTGKHEKCHMACVELLRFDPNNKQAQKYFSKSQNGLQKQNLKIAYEKLKQHLTKSNDTIRQ